MSMCASPSLSQLQRAYVTGRVEGMDGMANLYVELRELGNGTAVERETVAVDGTFHFRDLPSGSYEVKVVSALHNDTVLQDFVEVHPLSGQLVLRLPGVQ